MIDRDVFVRQFAVPVNVSIDELIVSLRVRRVTGEIRIVLSQGGTRQVILEEQTSVASSKTPEILEILNKV